jgi:aminoglycoside phosphotransferase (APT) family kinase protein
MTFASDNPNIEAALTRVARQAFPGALSIAQITRLSGGASQETWSFTACGNGTRSNAILRRSPSQYQPSQRAAGIETEAQLMTLAKSVGVPVPEVRYVLKAADGLGRGFVMTHVEGETIPRKILRDHRFAAIRPRLAHDFGVILARIHAIDVASLPSLRVTTALSELEELRAAYDNDGQPRPVFELALRWLMAHAPPPRSTPRLVHGDFRNGNLIIGPEGVRAVLDWELAHRGDPFEDLGWICVNSWRFGEIDKPVGGLGMREDLFKGYADGGGDVVDASLVRYWEILGTLRWGVMCLGMLNRFSRGEDRSVERAMIGRRASETEIDLLRLLATRV